MLTLEQSYAVGSYKF